MANRYWVGGSGNWSDAENHWAAMDGGSPGAGLFPTSADDVFFTSSSGLNGQSITMDGAYYSVVCHDFTVTTSDLFELLYGSSDVSIYGSLTIQAGVTIDTSLYMFLLSDTSETITCNGGVLNYLFVGYDNDSTYTSGTWSVADNMQIYTLELYSGTLQCNNVSIDILYRLGCIGGTVDEGTSTITINTGSVLDAYDDLTLYDLVFDGNTSLWLYNTTPLTLTVNDITLNPGSSCSFDSKSTVVVNGQFYANGNIGNEITLGSSSLRGPYYFASNDSTTAMYNGGITAISQSFVGNGERLDFVYKESRANVGSPTGNITCKIYAHSGTYGTSSVPTGTALATSTTVDVTTIVGDTSQKYYYFNDENSIMLENSTNYTVVWEYSGGDASNYIQFSGDTTSPTHDGNYAAYNGSWTASSGTDLSWWSIYTLSQHNITKTSGTVSCDYMNILDSNAGGGASFYAGANSVDVINNDGWIFSNPQTVGPFPTSLLDLL